MKKRILLNQTNNRRAKWICILLILVGCLANAPLLYSQCAAPSFGSSQSSCGTGGPVTMSATNYGMDVSVTSLSHKWYTTNTGGTPFATTTASHPSNSPQGTWSSTYSANLSASTTFYVSSYCNNSNTESTSRVAVSFTIEQPGSITISTGNTPPFLCIGSSITLTPNGGSGYSWSSSPAGASGSGSITVSPNVETTYTLSGIESKCNTSKTASITVKVSPSVGQVAITSGPGRICQGTTSSNYGATATNVNYYQWSLSPANAGTINSSGTVTWNSSFSGAATVSVTAFSGTNCNFTTNASTTVNVVPSPITPSVVSPVNVLYNSIFTLTASGARPEETYKWYDQAGNLFPATTIGPLVSSTSYSFSVAGYNSNPGCETPQAQRTPLVINLYLDAPPLPQVSINTCGPKTVTIAAAPANVTWYWQGTNANGQDTSTPVNSTYSVTASGVYYIRGKANTLNLWSSAVPISVTVDPVDILVTSYDPNAPVVQASNSISFDPGFSVPSGQSFSAAIVISPECNDLVNWSEQVIYDQSGQVVISDTRSYFNGFGEELESQSKDFLSKKVIGAQSLFNSFGLAVGASLPAPIQEPDFIFKPGLLTNADGQPYAAEDFDKRTTTNLSGSGEINYPKVAGKQPGTTGWYYSTANNLEPNTAITQYPYSRTYSPEGADPKTSISAGAGDQFRMGSGHESKGEKTLISADDATKLSHYYSLRSFFSTSTTPSGAGKGYRYITTDANGKQAVSFVDADGRSIASAVATLVNGTIYDYDYWNYTYYNDAGQVTATVAPKDVVTSNTTNRPPATEFKYDQLGRLIETTSPDEGTSRFVYSIDGKIRFSENQEQRALDGGTKRFSYTNYDRLGRLVESGEYTSSAGGYIFEPHSTITPASNSVLNFVDINFTVPIEQVNASNFTGVSEMLDPVRCSEHNFMTYDVAGSGSPSVQNFLFGQVSKTENENATTWYSYDEDGLLVWMKQSIAGLGIKTIDYTYDYFGNVTQVAYQAGTSNNDAFYHHYTYDINQRLTEVHTSKDGSNKTLQAKYYYYLHGPLRRVELAGNLQGIDYVYTIDGSLKSINHADIAKDPGNDGSNGVSADVFGMTLEYHPNDYQGAAYSAGTITGSGATDYYNGLIKSASWFTPIDNPSTKNIYGYSYDNLYQFQNAQFGSLTGTAGNYAATYSTIGAYNESIPSYDKNGNILSLTRKGKTGNSLANFNYNYSDDNNKLNSITGSANIVYEYNKIGQLTKQTEGSVITKISYNAYGLVKEVNNGSDQLLATYSYDDHGDLVKRVAYNAGVPAKTTYYVHDAAGNVLAIYEQPESGAITLAEVPIYGAGRIATYKPTPNTTFYEINDHLGNVRAVIGAPGTEVITATMESENAATEDLKFKNIAPRQVSAAANNTAGGNEAIRINNGQPSGGYAGRSTGAGIVLHVAPGDMISAEVFGYYEGGNGYSNSLPLATIVSNVASAFGGASGAPGDPGKIFSSFNSAINSGVFAGAGGTGSDTEPAAYLNMIMFDENMISNPVTLPMAAAKLSSAANMNKQKISIGPINIPAPGYVYIYVNNNSDVNNWIYFDDLKVTHLHSPFVAGGDYYPFGLTMDDRQIKVEDYRYGYQGQYSEENTQTGWNEFELRMYDSRIARWISPDPYGQYASPYIGMGNNPVNQVDPNGGLTNPFGEARNVLSGVAAGPRSIVMDGVRASLENGVISFIDHVSVEFASKAAYNTFRNAGLGAMNALARGSGGFQVEYDARFVGDLSFEDPRGLPDEFINGLNLAEDDGFIGKRLSAYEPVPIATGAAEPLFIESNFIPFTKGLQGIQLASKTLGATAKSFPFRVTQHFLMRIAGRVARGITPRKAIDAYNNGRLYYNPDSRNYVRFDPKTKISVVVSKMTKGKAITVFEGNASPRWQPVKWKPN